MATTRIPTDLHVSGDLTAKSMSLPAGSVGDDQVVAGAGIASSKLEQRPHENRQLVAPGTTIAAKTELLKVVFGTTGTIESFRAVCTTVPTGDYVVEVDLEKSTGGGAFATVLNAPIVFSVAESSVDRVFQEANVDVSALVDGDVLQVVVTVSGTTGAQGQGLAVCLVNSEAPI